MEFFELAPSPNNVKIRLALRFKGIDFVSVPVDPRDRRPIVELSGQELTPVIRDRGIVLNDSEAILQFLDANYPGKPRLFPAHREGRRECDEWKRQVDQRVARPWARIFFYAIGRADSVNDADRAAFHAGLQWLERELGDRTRFRGQDMPICDLRAAIWALYPFPGAGLLQRVPFFKKLHAAFETPDEDFPSLRRFLEPWQELLQ